MATIKHNGYPVALLDNKTVYSFVDDKQLEYDIDAICSNKSENVFIAYSQNKIIMYAFDTRMDITDIIKQEINSNIDNIHIHNNNIIVASGNDILFFSYNNSIQFSSKYMSHNDIKHIAFMNNEIIIFTVNSVHYASYDLFTIETDTTIYEDSIKWDNQKINNISFIATNGEKLVIFEGNNIYMAQVKDECIITVTKVQTVLSDKITQSSIVFIGDNIVIIEPNLGCQYIYSNVYTLSNVTMNKHNTVDNVIKITDIECLFEIDGEYYHVKIDGSMNNITKYTKTERSDCGIKLSNEYIIAACKYDSKKIIFVISCT